MCNGRFSECEKKMSEAGNPIQRREVESDDEYIKRLIANYGLNVDDFVSGAVELRRGSDIRPLPISWLWKMWLPSGKLTILAGASGTGKTTIALTLGASVTTGRPWPDGTCLTHAGNILIWSSEDNPEDTLVPRLMAAEADLSRCYFIGGVTENCESRSFDPSIDIPKLQHRLETIGGCELLIIDPIVSAVAGDMHRANDVRRSLQSLVDFAERHNTAVIGISHFTKGSAGRSPQDRVIGSQAFAALARMVLVAAIEDDGNLRVLVRAKSNIAPQEGGFSYELNVASLAEGIETTAVEWKGCIDGNAREILDAIERGANDDSDCTDVQRFLAKLLGAGTMYVSEIREAADNAGISMSAITRAGTKLGIKKIKDSEFQGKWKWYLPQNSPKNAHTFHTFQGENMQSMKSMK
jgi:putative DNA primase/helicase